MKTIRIALLAAALTVLGSVPGLAQSGQDLLQQALVKEQADGDLRAAITIYQRIVREFASDRTPRGRALMQLGRCHERLGEAESARGPQGVRARRARVRRPDRDGGGGPRPPGSADGDEFSGKRIDHDSASHLDGPQRGRLWSGVPGRPLHVVHRPGDRRSRHPRPGDRPGPAVDGQGPLDRFRGVRGYSVFSPDSRQIACNWYNSSGSVRPPHLRARRLEAAGPADRPGWRLLHPSVRVVA